MSNAERRTNEKVMTLIDLWKMEWTSIALASTIAVPTGILFGAGHDMYQYILKPWLSRLLHRRSAK